jgi:hypothetical protein
VVGRERTELHLNTRREGVQAGRRDGMARTRMARRDRKERRNRLPSFSLLVVSFPPAQASKQDRLLFGLLSYFSHPSPKLTLISDRIDCEGRENDMLLLLIKEMDHGAHGLHNQNAAFPHLHLHCPLHNAKVSKGRPTCTSW